MRRAGPRAIIFDFNGVIADDELTHFLAFQQVLSEYGLSLTQEEYYGTYLGMDERTCAAALVQLAKGAEDPALVDQITMRKSSLFSMLTAEQKPPLFPGVVEFVKSARERCHLAIASGGRREQIEFALRGTPIEGDFAVIVSAEDAPIGKPDPAIYRIALEKLNRAAPPPAPLLTPTDCLVIEDSLAGIQAAKTAGMKTIAVSTTYAAHRLIDADIVVERLKDLDWTTVEKLFN